MIEYEFCTTKNDMLKETRGVCFEDVIDVLILGDELDIVQNPNQSKYQHQKMYVVDINNYVYLVPFVRTKDKIFLKTLYPSRKSTKYYLGV